MLTGLLALIGSVLTAWSGVPDRSTEAESLTAALRALPAVESVDGRYARDQSAGYAYNVDIRMSPELQLGDDVIRVFGNDRHRHSPAPEAGRWFALIDAVPGRIGWAVGPDPATDLRSITLELDRPAMDGDPAQLAALPALLAARASDLADRQWIVRWRKLRLDLMGPEYPATEVVTLIAELAATGQWSAVHDPTAAPTLKLAVWAASPERMGATARSHLSRIETLGFPVSYTVRANRTEPVEVLVGGCLPGGSELQQQLNREFGSC